jgi:hypothetical protein
LASKAGLMMQLGPETAEMAEVRRAVAHPSAGQKGMLEAGETLMTDDLDAVGTAF